MRRVGVLALVLAASASIGATDLKVVIREWDVPTPNSRPHDPDVAPDGALWYIGKLDPKSREVTEYAMPDPRVRDPHSLVFRPWRK